MPKTWNGICLPFEGKAARIGDNNSYSSDLLIADYQNLNKLQMLLLINQFHIPFRPLNQHHSHHHAFRNDLGDALLSSAESVDQPNTSASLTFSRMNLVSHCAR